MRKNRPAKTWISSKSRFTCFLTIIKSSFAIDDSKGSEVDWADTARRQNTSYTLCRHSTLNPSK
jgi:hypothetical protein